MVVSVLVYIHEPLSGRALCLECRVPWFESHPRQLIILRKSDCLGCAVLLCLVVCLTLLKLASTFLLISHYYCDG